MKEIARNDNLLKVITHLICNLIRQRSSYVIYECPGEAEEYT